MKSELLKDNGPPPAPDQREEQTTDNRPVKKLKNSKIMNTKQLPRGIRNNNPLNIRYVERNKWKGRRETNTDGEFEQFESMKWGIRAAYILIHNYIHIYGLQSIKAIVSRWAPAEDGNDPDSYAERVRELMEKCSVNYRLDFSNGADMVRLVYAMAIVENGTRLGYHAIMEGYAMACADMNIEPHLGGINSYVYEDMDVTQAAMQRDFEYYIKK